MKYLVSLIFLLVVMGCSDDDDTVVDPNPDSSGLQGTWNLSNVTGGFIGVNEDFEKGIIVWVFDESNKKVEITNNDMTSSSTGDLLPTGIYSYSIIEVHGNKELLINDRNLGNFEITANEFSIDEQFKDGFRFTFQR
ncbi:hypothetical protein [Aquimarina aquimarini]|uniref:hypothetical protein n=1 Tax=Aquimarina aquimarini TaxID=1191734 RepID=UPI00131F207E|nr:hypothetical protein [Aquimarina aquimarini]